MGDMGPRVSSHRLVGGFLIVLGIVLLLGGCAAFARQQATGEQLRAELQQTPAAAMPTASLAPTASAVAAANATSAPTVVAPTPTAVTPPSPTAQPVAAPAAAAPSASPTASPPPTRAPARVVPTPTPAPALPVRIIIPDLKIDAQVVEMGWQVVRTASGPQSEWVIPQNAAGHHINSATLDQPGNVVLSGHNNIEGKVFEPISLAWDEKTRTRVDDITDRSEILKGRQIQLYDAAGRPFNYTITDFVKLKDSGVSLAQRVENAQYMAQTADKRLTLVTCWPPWSNTHRLVVIAQPSQP